MKSAYRKDSEESTEHRHKTDIAVNKDRTSSDRKVKGANSKETEPVQTVKTEERISWL